MGIDTQGPQPLGSQIRDDLVRRMQTGEFAIGDRIPSLRSLVTEYGVAELTVHNAVRELQNAGVLESASGRGTFVKRVPAADETQGGDLADLREEVAALRQRVDALERGCR